MRCTFPSIRPSSYTDVMRRRIYLRENKQHHTSIECGLWYRFNPIKCSPLYSKHSHDILPLRCGNRVILITFSNYIFCILIKVFFIKNHNRFIFQNICLTPNNYTHFSCICWLFKAYRITSSRVSKPTSNYDDFFFREKRETIK